MPTYPLIYPVQMMPIDWFQSLSTSFTMEDLTSKPEVIYQQINAKSKLLDLLQARLAALQLSPKNDLKALKLAAEQAQSEYSKCQSNLQKTYTSNVISLAQSFVSGANVFQYALFLSNAKILKIPETSFNGIEESMQKATAAHDTVNSASRAYSQALSAVALAEATDTTRETTSITLQIDAIRKEITELTTRVQALSASPAATADTPKPSPKLLADVPLFEPPPSGTAGGSRWQEITLSHTTSNIREASSTRSSSSVSGYDVSFFWVSKKQTTSLIHTFLFSDDAPIQDITIKVKMNADQLSKRAKEFEESVQSSSGIFCWSNSGSSQTKSSERETQTISVNDGLIIRIPGPQILGYMLQYVDNDLTQDMDAELPDDFLISDEDYEAGFAKVDNAPKAPSRAAHALAPTVADSSTDIPETATAVASAPSFKKAHKEEPVYSSGYYFAPKSRV